MSRGVRAPSGNAGEKGKEKRAPSAPLVWFGDVTSAVSGEGRAERARVPLTAREMGSELWEETGKAPLPLLIP